jgi:hypothetical protein
MSLWYAFVEKGHQKNDRWINALKTGEATVANLEKPGAWEKFKLNMIKDKGGEVFFNIVSFHGKMLRCLDGTLVADHVG